MSDTSEVTLDLDANERTTVYGIAARVRAYKSAMWADRDFQLLLSHAQWRGEQMKSLREAVSRLQRERDEMREALDEMATEFLSEAQRIALSKNLAARSTPTPATKGCEGCGGQATHVSTNGFDFCERCYSGTHYPATKETET
jgi:hypothetical protein